MRLDAALALFLVLAAAGVTSCRASKARAAADLASQPAGKAPAQRPTPQAAPIVTPPESPWFPPQDWSERRAPEDFRIGPLESGGGEEAAYRRLEAVCDGLVKGRVETGSLDPSRAAGLTQRLSDQIQRGGAPSEYRIGKLELLPEGSAWARVRFLGPSGSVEGEAYLARLADGWFVTDMQIDLSTAKPAPQRREPFVPSPYRERTD